MSAPCRPLPCLRQVAVKPRMAVRRERTPDTETPLRPPAAGRIRPRAFWLGEPQHPAKAAFGSGSRPVETLLATLPLLRNYGRIPTIQRGRSWSWRLLVRVKATLQSQMSKSVEGHLAQRQFPNLHRQRNRPEALLRNLEMADSPSHGPVQAWCDTVRHLFAIVYQAVPVYVKSRGSFSDWKKMAAAITREIFTTKWAFKEIVRRFASKHKWAHSTVLSQWAQVVRSGTADPSPDPPHVSSRTPRIEETMVDPLVFSGEDVTRLRAVCGTSWTAVGQHKVFRREDRLRLFSTIQAQVEGELILKLDRARGI
uniref:Uncharacterized protein n=1 Tax=Hyaloperonospora arabidopsidis (strain Emoy2) TaxID=559515 RepID=M4BQP9_HYAAE